MGEFSSHWSVDAPADLRATLSQLLIQDLSGLEFEDALEACTALRQYIEGEESKRTSVKDEFQNHWGEEAPFQLRSKLEELINNRGDGKADDDDGNEKEVSYPAKFYPLPLRSRL